MTTKNFEAVKDNLENVQEFIFNSISSDKINEKNKNQLRIVIEEIFINIASYSYVGRGIAEIGVEFENDILKIVFTDNGVKFNPLELDDPNVAAAAEERGIGGLGIFMVKNMMDDVQYEYKDNKNILTLIKKY